jgi:hypothetical protein
VSTALFVDLAIEVETLFIYSGCPSIVLPVGTPGPFVIILHLSVPTSLDKSNISEFAVKVRASKVLS